MYGSTTQPNDSEEDMSQENEDVTLRRPLSMEMVQEDEQNRQTQADGNGRHDSSTTTLLPFKFPFYLLCIVPEQNPVLWIVINNSLAISGCLLILDLLYAKTEIEERPFAFAFYLIWEFSVCLFWTLETGLSMAYQTLVLHLQKHPWYTKLELVIAVYFMIDTAWMLIEWNVMNREVAAADVWEVAIDTVFYVYLAIRSCTSRGTATSSESDDEQNNDGNQGDAEPLQKQQQQSNRKLDSKGNLVDSSYHIMPNGNPDATNLV